MAKMKIQVQIQDDLINKGRHLVAIVRNDLLVGIPARDLTLIKAKEIQTAVSRAVDYTLGLSRDIMHAALRDVRVEF